MTPPPPLCFSTPPGPSVVNGRKVFVLASFSEVSMRRQGVSWDRKPIAGAVWKQLYSTEPSKGDGDDLSRDYARTHTHRPAPLEERCWGKRRPQCETSVNKCAREVKVQHTSIFSPASYSLQETFEALAGWYGFALGAAKFVYTYSTIHQLLLWCLEDVTDILIRGCHSTHDQRCPLYITS